MRVARLVGLSPDGRSLIVATDSGEELAIAADDRLRAALRGDRPRLGQLEIEMESALTPREIQSRIRSGASLEEVTRAAGIPMERVERFAAPVVAEREHVASLAMTSSVRRRGETSGHRTLRGVLTERLRSRGVDVDSVLWDSYRLADGRWAVTASYASGEASRRAEFLYDLGGRYSVAGNDDARWILSEQSPSRGPQPGRRRAEGAVGGDEEPTLDLSDELAIVRALQDPPPAVPDDQPIAAVHALHAMPGGAEGAEPIAVAADEQDVPADGQTVEPADGTVHRRGPTPVADQPGRDGAEDGGAGGDEDGEHEDEDEPEDELEDEAGGLDTLSAMLDGPLEQPTDQPTDQPDRGPGRPARHQSRPQRWRSRRPDPPGRWCPSRRGPPTPPLSR